MTIPTTSWSETSPAGSDNVSAGDNRIREMKTQIREVIDVDHKFDSSGQSADMGKHNQVSFIETADGGTGSTGYSILSGQTVSGAPELVYTDEGDNDVQITSGGYLNGGALVDGSNDFQSSALKTALIDFLYPIGTIYTEITGTNPNTTFGVGTWTAFGAGRVPVGYDSGDTDFDSAEETGGAKTHTLTVDEMPAHTHTDTMYNANGWASGDYVQASNATSPAGNLTTDSTGGGGAHNNLQPYIVVHMWKRTA